MLFVAMSTRHFFFFLIVLFIPFLELMPHGYHSCSCICEKFNHGCTWKRQKDLNHKKKRIKFCWNILCIKLQFLPFEFVVIVRNFLKKKKEKESFVRFFLVQQQLFYALTIHIKFLIKSRQARTSFLTIKRWNDKRKLCLWLCVEKKCK